jgi:hypothetical protein
MMVLNGCALSLYQLFIHTERAAIRSNACLDFRLVERLWLAFARKPITCGDEAPNGALRRSLPAL